jgi:hypothetical protein
LPKFYCCKIAYAFTERSRVAVAVKVVLCQINQLFFFCFLCLLWADIDGYDNHKVKGQLLSIYREDDPNRLALKWSDAGKETAGYNPGTFYAVFLVFVSQLD